MITTVYQLVNNMEANYAGKVAIQYYDEAKGGVVSIRYGQYAQDIRRAAGLLLHRDPDIRGKKVCLLARNGYDFLVNMFSVLLTTRSSMSWTWWNRSTSSTTASSPHASRP